MTPNPRGPRRADLAVPRRPASARRDFHAPVHRGKRRSGGRVRGGARSPRLAAIDGGGRPFGTPRPPCERRPYAREANGLQEHITGND
jgi:hypothetical protein